MKKKKYFTGLSPEDAVWPVSWATALVARVTMSSEVTVTMLISLSDVDASAHPSAPSSALPPATTRRFMPALPWWTVFTWERRLSTRLNPLPHLSHRKGFSPARERDRQKEKSHQCKTRGGKEQHQQQENGCLPFYFTTSKPLNYVALILPLPVWMIMCFDRSPTLTNALLHIWHLCGRTLSWCRMWLASWLDCTNLYRERHKISVFKGWGNKNKIKTYFLIFFIFSLDNLRLYSGTRVWDFTAWTHLLADLLPQRSHT